MLNVEVNEMFVIHNDYNLLPINVGVQIFATSNDCKHPIVMNTIVFLTDGKGLAEEGKGI